MASVPWVKYDDGTSDGFSANCFPVRSLIRQSEDVSGAWLYEQRAEQRRRFKAVLCTKPKTYAQIKEERKRCDREGTSFNPAEIQNLDEDEEQPESPALDGFFLMRHCCIEDPSDLCSVNIAGKELSEYKEEDFALFDNVAYVNASENYLPFEAFRGFPIIRELEIPLNGLRSIKLSPGDYPSLEIVDISYNNLSHDDVLSLGTLPNLKVLHLTGNNFKSLPPDMALPFQDNKSKRKIPRFKNLEILMLDDNKLSNVALFAALAGLRRLRHLNLERNEIFYVPQLKSVEGSMVVSEEGNTGKRKKSARSGKKTSRTPRIKPSQHGSKKSDHTIDEATASETHGPQNTEASLPAPANSEVVSDQPDTEVKVEVEVKDEKREEPEVDLNEDFGDLSKSLADLDITADIPEPESESEPMLEGKNPIVNNFGQEPKGPALPPFPELRSLNLSSNMIAEEEALLSVAAWPMLSELLIANNPLTTNNSGDPPLLKRFLQDRLGIQLIRKKVTDSGKPTIEIPVKKSRKVSNRVPKIPRLSAEEKLMLEAPPRPPSGPKPSSVRKSHDKPLPPIQSRDHPTPPTEDRIPSASDYQRVLSQQEEKVPESTTYHKQFSQESESGIPQAIEYKRQFSEESGGVPESASYRRPHSETPLSVPGEADYNRQFSPAEQKIPSPPGYQRPYSAGAKPKQKEEVPDKPESKSAWSDEQPDQAFFMTQVDDQEEQNVEKTKTKGKTKKEKPKQKKLNEKYKGYEILLDYEDDPNFVDPADVQGNIKALKFALGHELVYRDAAARLDRIEKPIQPYRKWEMPPRVPRKTRGERVDDVLTTLKNRVTVDEANLSQVLKDPRAKKKQFPDAQNLLAEIQKRYNSVRVASMKEAREVKKVLTGTADELSKKVQTLKAT